MIESQQAIQARIIALAAQVLKIDATSIEGKTRLLEDLAMDSRTRFELFARVADDFDLQFEPDEGMLINTIDDACGFVSRYLNAAAKGS